MPENTSKSITLLTPKQRDLWTDPRLAELIKRFDLQPLKSPEIEINNAISARIDSWCSQFADPNHVEPPRMIKYVANGITYESPF